MRTELGRLLSVMHLLLSPVHLLPTPLHRLLSPMRRQLTATDRLIVRHVGGRRALPQPRCHFGRELGFAH